MKTADSLARQHTERAIETLAEVMADPFAENRERLTAANSLLDRGHGKPNQAIIAIPGNRELAALLAKMSNDELAQIVQQSQLPRLAPIDASFTEVAPLPTAADVEKLKPVAKRKQANWEDHIPKHEPLLD